MKNVKEELARHAATKKKLFENIKVAPDGIFEVVDEATLHLVEHFEHRYKRDYVFFMSKVLIGKDQTNGKKASGTSIYIDGDIHEFAHDLCEQMRDSKELALMIIHALQLYRGH